MPPGSTGGAAGSAVRFPSAPDGLRSLDNAHAGLWQVPAQTDSAGGAPAGDTSHKPVLLLDRFGTTSSGRLPLSAEDIESPPGDGSATLGRGAHAVAGGALVRSGTAVAHPPPGVVAATVASALGPCSASGRQPASAARSPAAPSYWCQPPKRSRLTSNWALHVRPCSGSEPDPKPSSWCPGRRRRMGASGSPRARTPYRNLHPCPSRSARPRSCPGWHSSPRE
jgi:hypothetical protein